MFKNTAYITVFITITISTCISIFVETYLILTARRSARPQICNQFSFLYFCIINLSYIPHGLIVPNHRKVDAFPLFQTASSQIHMKVSCQMTAGCWSSFRTCLAFEITAMAVTCALSSHDGTTFNVEHSASFNLFSIDATLGSFAVMFSKEWSPHVSRETSKVPIVFNRQHYFLAQVSSMSQYF